MKKRILAITLALCMALTLFAGLPLSASAANFTVVWPTDLSSGTPPTWAINATKEEQDATIQAIYDEYDYQASLGFDMGENTGGGLTYYGNVVSVQFNNGDHTTNPWGQDRRMGAIVAPYAGTAFSIKADYSSKFVYTPLGNQTTWTNPGDKTYLIQMGTVAQYVAPQLTEDAYGAIEQWPEYVGWGAANVEAFQKAYAYAAAGITTGKRLNLGYTPSNVQTAADGSIEWQELRGDENTGSYGMFVDGGIALIAMKAGSDEAYIICDDMFNAWKTTWVGETQNDLTSVDMFSVTGAPVGNPVTVDGATYQAFENGTFVAKDGELTGPFESDVNFTVDFDYKSLEVVDDTYYYTVADDADVSKLDLGIKAVGEKSTISPDLAGEQDYSKPVTFTVTAESGLSATYTIVIISNKSASVEDRLAALKVNQMIDNLPATIFANDLDTIDAIKAAYNALTPAQKSMVDMSSVDALATRIAEIKAGSPIRISCVGDSITDGIGASSKAMAYPGQMQTMLGSAYSVGNFGTSGSNVRTDTGYVYMYTDTYYPDSKNFNPDIVIIALGTNDAGNLGAWTEASKVQFENDYRDLVESYLNLPTKPLVMCALPTHSWNLATEEYDGRNNNNVDLTIPLIEKVTDELGVQLLDMWTWSEGKMAYFGDGLHPNDAGYTLMAEEYMKYVLEATEIIGDISIDSIELDGEAMVEFDEATKNYKVEVEDLNDLPTVEAKYTESTNKTVVTKQATAADPTATVTVTSAVGTRGTVYSITFYEGIEDDPAVADVAKLIENIDDADITLADDEATVELAQLSYNALSTAQKAKISDELTKKLDDAVAAIKALNDKNAADAVIKLIDAIGTVDVNSGAAITAADDAYNALTADQKELVDNAKKLTDAKDAYAALAPVLDAITLIEALPDTTDVAISYQADIEAAKSAYDALTDDQKAMVSKELVTKLNDAIDALDAVLAAYTKYEAEDAVLTGGVAIQYDGAEDVSGGKYVNNIGGDTGSGGIATFTVSVADAGEYQLDIYYITFVDRTYDISVNGGASMSVSCPGNGSSWNGNVLMSSLVVTLNAGDNTIAIANNTNWGANLDFIALPAAPAEPSPDQEAANTVIQQIDALGTITALTQKADVEAARAAYDALSNAQKLLVTNAQKLIDAEAAIKALEDAQNPPVETLRGDVNADGKVDVTDIILLKNLIMTEECSEAQLAAGDLNDSDSLDVGDIIAIKNIIMSK